ncbi:hypothetical protein F4808DRAFT_129655 [Astrocystis sublimbata]|nr:hypothetical protein F4808DRAFT_129655 [Astrocystis sublimbata]
MVAWWYWMFAWWSCRPSTKHCSAASIFVRPHHQHSIPLRSDRASGALRKPNIVAMLSRPVLARRSTYSKLFWRTSSGASVGSEQPSDLYFEACQAEAAQPRLSAGCIVPGAGEVSVRPLID